MLPIKLVLMIVAVVLFALAAIGVPSGRFGLMAGGLCAWALAETLV